MKKEAKQEPQPKEPTLVELKAMDYDVLLKIEELTMIRHQLRAKIQAMSEKPE